MGFKLFIETNIFKNKIDTLGDSDLLKKIQDEILKDRTKGDIVQGTGGLRKIRVAKKQSGKSGGYRVFYLDVLDKGIIYLMTILDKRDSENISDEEKVIFKEFVKKLKGGR